MMASTTENLVAYEELRVMARDSRHRSVRVWRPANLTHPRATLVVGHSYLEHGGRYRELAHALAQRGFTTVALDLQGHGRSPGRRGYVKAFADYEHDVSTALAQAPKGPIFYLGHSLGGLIALHYFQTSETHLAGLMLSNPYLDHAPPGPSAWRKKLGAWAGRLAPWLSVSSGLKPQMLTSDPVMLDAIERDPLIGRAANASWYREVSHIQPSLRNIRVLPMPVLFIYSANDPIASPVANRAFAEALNAPTKQIVMRPNERHEVLFERARTELYDLIIGWMSDRLP